MLKSFFLSTWLTGLLALSVYGITLFNQAGLTAPALRWIGMGILASAAPGLLLIASYFVFPRARTSKNLTLWSVIQVLGFVLGLFGWWWDQPLKISSFLALIFCLSGWFLYVFWYSKLKPSHPTPLRVGEALPSLEFQTPDGQSVSSEDWKGKTTLILFYRGNWCPLCMAQIREIAAQYRDLAAAGVRVVLISPQTEKHSQGLAEKFEAPMDFLCDREGKMAQKLGIFHAWGLPLGLQVLGYDKDTVFPTLVIVDAAGQVRLVEIADNYRVRPEPQVFLELLQREGLMPS